MSNNKMLIDAGHPEETRVVMVRGNRVDEFDFESEHKTQLRGNIYLAKVTRVEPSLQAAFVDYGGNRHGFLAFSEIHPDYYQIPVADRQALLDAEAEDAREAAEAEARQDEDDLELRDEVKEKPTRKRRSRRRGKSDGAAQSTDEQAAAEETGQAESENTQSDNVDADNVESDSAESEVATIAATEDSNSAAEQSDAANTSAEADHGDDVADAETNEENDDDDTTIAAENDGDDVVSEPAKPARKVTRRPRKKAADEPAEAQASAEETSEAAKAPEETPAVEADAEPAKPKRRRTSRKKPEPVAQADADSVVEETAARGDDGTKSAPAGGGDDNDDGEVEAKAEKPKRRRTSRKKKVDATDATDATTDATASSETPPAAEVAQASEGENTENAASEVAASDVDEPKPRKTRSRSRSRRRKKSDDTENTETAKFNDSDAENSDSVEEMGSEDALEEVPTRRAPRRHYKIQEVIKRRQILLVQVVKEERGNKGAALTTYLSLAGRYSVLMPNTARGGGISRKITNASDRKRLKTIATGLEVPQGMGVILRTAGASRKPEDIQRDFEYLMRLWENVRSLTLESTAPCLVYEEGSLIKRAIRDLYDKDTGEILVAGEAGYREAKDFMTMLMPNHAKNVKLYRDRIPMFARMGVEAQLDAMLQPEVTLRSGGYIIIDQTEALVAIDVNSGRSTRQHSIEETATQTNLEAADEVARQLRLRDLAGLIVIDFIDMEDKRNIRSVEKRLKDALKDDRARIQVGRISHFGLMEMSRQRIRASVLESTTQTCPTCDGLGHVRAASSIAISILRSIEEHLNRNSRNNLVVKVSADTALYMLNNKRDNLGDLENRFGVSLSIATDDTLGNTPCSIERGEVSNRKPAQDTAVQPDSIEITEDADIEVTSSADQQEAVTGSSANAAEADAGEVNGTGKKRRRRRRRRKGNGDEENESVEANGEAAASDNSASAADDAADKSDAADVNGDAAADDKPAEPATSTGRVKRTRRSRAKSTDEAVETAPNTSEIEVTGEVETTAEADVPAKKPTRTRRKKAVAKAEADPAEADANNSADGADAAPEADAEAPAKPKRATTRRKKTAEPKADASAATAATTATADAVVETAPDTDSASTPASTAQTEPTEAVVADAGPKKNGWWQRKFF